MAADKETAPPAWLSWLRLFRLPNVFTALADVVMGYAVVTRGEVRPLPLVLLLLASGCLYIAGMVLNDVFDIEQDAKERPHRPLPSGQISLATARAIGFALLGTGIILGGAIGYLPGAEGVEYRWRGGVVAVLLALAVVLYDAVLKRTFAGPVFMGLCRFFNVLLGMSIAGAGEKIVAADRPWTLYFTDGQLLIAGALGVYVLGITLFARKEAHAGNQPQLVQGLAVMLLGLSMLLFVPKYVLQADAFVFRNDWVWPALLIMLGISVARHCVAAIVDPQPRRIQMAVKFSILCIITFDAAVALWAAGPVFGLAIFLLVLPMLLLGRLVYST